MDKVENPYLAVLDRVHLLDRSIHVLTLVNNDLRHILHKQSVEFVRLTPAIPVFLISFSKPLPQFVQDSFKRAPISRSKTSPALPPPTPVGKQEELHFCKHVIRPLFPVN